MHTAQLQCPQALQPRNVTFLHHRPSLPSVHSRPTAARAAAAGTKRAAAAAAAPAGRSVLPETAAPSRLLFVGGLPASTHAEDLEQQLAGLCAAAGLQPTRVQVVPFDSDRQRSKFADGWLHKGFALLAFCDEGSVAAAATAIRTQGPPEWGPAATMGPARKAPADWPASLTYTPEELAALQQQQADIEARREHNRRQRRRQAQRSIDSVQQLLSGLRQPFGHAAQQLYQPLLTRQACEQLRQAAASGGSDPSSLPPRLQESIRWPVLTALLQQQQDQQHHHHHHQQQPGLSVPAGPVQLGGAGLAAAQVESQLLLDWGTVPASLDPAFGGRLADGDVVRAGRGRMNLRAVRKRVQVECFALLLWQLTAQHTRQPPPDSTTSSSTTGSSSSTTTSSTSSTSSAPAQPLHVVDFGSGSGNLILPLAHLFPHCTFTAVDMKPSAVQLLQQRADQAGLANVTAQLGRIEEYAGPADVVLALHACGSATDWALAQAAQRRASFIVSPCCIGKINRHSSGASSTSSSSGGGGGGGGADSTGSKQAKQQQQQQHLKFPDANRGLQYPRSQQLQQQMAGLAQQVQQELQQAQQSGAEAQPLPLNKLQEAVLGSGSTSSSSDGDAPPPPGEQCARALFSILAATADYSHQEDHSHPQLAGLAKTNVELDRGWGMREAGYRVALLRLLLPELTAKSDVLVGVHSSGSSSGGVADGEGGQQWGWAAC